MSYKETSAGGSGTVTTVSVTAASGVSGSVATATTTPAITITLGNISPTSVTSTFTGNLTGNVTGNVSGTAPAGTLTGATLAAGVTASSLTSVGTITSGTWSGTMTTTGLSAITSTVYLSGDVSNSLNPAAWADVTAFSFAVASGATYAFEFYCQTTTAATTTRASYGVNGPTNSLLVVNVSQFGGSTGNTAQGNSATAYDTMNNIQTTSGGSTALPTTITGLITTTASGTLILRQKSNVNSSAVTVKAGSWGRITRIA